MKRTATICHEFTPPKVHRMKTVRLFLVMAAGLAGIGLGTGSELFAGEGGATGVTVEVLIFSGRPNPIWHLQDTNRLHALKTRLKDLPVAFEKEPAAWSVLGFAGFRIRGAEVLGLPSDLRVYQGVIQTGTGKAARYLKDAGRLEQSLIDEARKQALEPPVNDAIASYERARKAAP
jgi:hypothetical protein